MTDIPKRQPSLIGWIMLSLLVWGLLLAIGSWLYGGNHPLLRAAIIFGVTLAFLGFWLLMLKTKPSVLEGNKGSKEMQT